MFRQSAHIRLAFPVPCRSTKGRARERRETIATLHIPPPGRDRLREAGPFRSPGRIEFAVERGVQHEGAILAIRGADHANLPSLSIINVRARASRDMTVPTGVPVASAISR
jgi:hypothetical protein